MKVGVNMNSKYIKYALLKYFRFNRQMIVATEVQTTYGLSDILAVDLDKRRSIEVEIKISKADFKRDFKDKREKHIFFEHKHSANYFYFAFPSSLTAELIGHVPQQYGVISVFNHNEVKIKRQPQLINHLSDNEEIYNLIIKRNASELIKYYGRYEIDN